MELGWVGESGNISWTQDTPGFAWCTEGTCHRYKIRPLKSQTWNGSITKLTFPLLLEELKNKLLSSFVISVFQHRQRQTIYVALFWDVGKQANILPFLDLPPTQDVWTVNSYSCLLEEEDQALPLFLPKRTVNHDNLWLFYYLSQVQHRSFYKQCHGVSCLLPAASILVQRQKAWSVLWWCFTCHGVFPIPPPKSDNKQVHPKSWGKRWWM